VRPLSARNPRVQRLARLARRREERAEQRALLVEGPVLLGAALDAGAHVEEVYIDAAAVDRPAIVEVLARLPAGLEPWVLPAGVLERVGDAATSQGTAAVVRQADPPWPVPDRAPFVLVLADLGDPGNVGTLVRAAAASGAGAVVAAAGADPTSPKVVRASAGAVFGIDLVPADNPFEAVTRLHGLGYRVLVTAATGGVPHDRADLSGPLAIVVGNEARGIDPEVAALADGTVTIAMAGPTESLNAAMAGTVVCFEALRQRRAHGDPTGGG
jgi:TrmH family RNA methyltransferase